jgi:hypothetical protein
MKEVKSGEAKIVTYESVKDMLESIRNKKYPWYERVYNNIVFSLQDLSWDIYRFFKPCHENIRKAIPRRWVDLEHLTLQVNFAIITSFVENEMESVDWNDHEGHREAATWLRSSYEYITKTRQQLGEDLNKEYDNIDHKSNASFYEKYAKVHQLEKLIDDKDRDVLIGLATYRKYLWT